VKKLKDRIDVLRVGNPLDKNTDIGAINSTAQLDKITELVECGVTEGASMYQPSRAVCRVPVSGSSRPSSRV
jgi:aldehyde dehydrogenase (NAD+)